MSDERKAHEQMGRPFLTTDPNIRAWLRHRRKAEVYEEQARIALEGVASRSQSPWSEVRPATAEDVIVGAVLWKPVGGKSAGGGDRHEWYYVERVSEGTGQFIDHMGRPHSVEGMCAEVYSADAHRQAENVEHMMGGSERSAIGMAHQVLGNKTGGTLYISAEFHETLTEEAKRLDPQFDEAGLTSLYGNLIVVDVNHEDHGMSYRRERDDLTFDPDGIRA